MPKEPRPYRVRRSSNPEKAWALDPFILANMDVICETLDEGLPERERSQHIEPPTLLVLDLRATIARRFVRLLTSTGDAGHASNTRWRSAIWTMTTQRPTNGSTSRWLKRIRLLTWFKKPVPPRWTSGQTHRLSSLDNSG